MPSPVVVAFPSPWHSRKWAPFIRIVPELQAEMIRSGATCTVVVFFIGEDAALSAHTRRNLLQCSLNTKPRHSWRLPFTSSFSDRLDGRSPRSSLGNPTLAVSLYTDTTRKMCDNYDTLKCLFVAGGVIHINLRRSGNFVGSPFSIYCRR